MKVRNASELGPVKDKANGYATVDDFRSIFIEGMDELYQLSFLLTADHRKAEQCFEGSLEDSLKDNNHVFKDWARSWAKRTILQNAIRQLKPRPPATSDSLGLPRNPVRQPSNQGRHLELNRVLALQDFERFVFVMSVLEGYSEHDCSLLLACSPREIREVRVQAIARTAESINEEPFDVPAMKLEGYSI